MSGVTRMTDTNKSKQCWVKRCKNKVPNEINRDMCDKHYGQLLIGMEKIKAGYRSEEM